MVRDLEAAPVSASTGTPQASIYPNSYHTLRCSAPFRQVRDR
jgi:hypothetical protein